MDNYDLIGALRSYATTNSWAFLYGDNFFQNYEASKLSYGPGQLILGADPFIATPKISYGGKVESITYQGLIMLGRKFESDLDEEDPQVTTTATLDELMIQKYDRRLKSLMETLSTHMILFTCAQQLEILSMQFELKINHLDENIDFVVASITLKQ